MIISHKHRYIFIKPKKVAGTSIEVALAKHLGPDDIMPPLTKYSKTHDRDKYEHHAQNPSGFYDHSPPKRIRKRIGEKTWRSYFKFTAIRNPWDMVVSAYFWELNKKVSFRDYFNVLSLRALFLDYIPDYRKIKRPKDLTSFVINLPKSYINTKYCFYKNGQPLANFYIRFENLEADFKKACKRIDIPADKLLSLKSKTRTSKKHYSAIYTPETRQIVADIFKKEINYFGYQFEDTH